MLPPFRFTSRIVFPHYLNKECIMPRFPEAEAEIAALAALVVEGLEQAVEDSLPLQHSVDRRFLVLTEDDHARAFERLATLGRLGPAARPQLEICT